jgi:8-oxo-dGTP pyrophosphatase MutT (NUDIX family)
MRGPRWAKRAFLQGFSRLPRRVRRGLVQVGAPSYIVGSMGVVEVDDEVLLVRQSYRDGWGIPGGLLNRGEAPDTAVVRELWEEVALAVVAEGPPSVVVEPLSRRVDLVFRCVPVAGSDPHLARPTSVEIEEARWFPVDALPDLQPEARRGLQVLGLLEAT